MFKLLFFSSVCLEVVFLPVYLFAGFCQSGKRPLIAKCICSGLFILIGVFAMVASSNYTTYAVLMIAGLFFSFWGDLFLGISMKDKIFIFGMLSFLTAHVFYIAAYSKVITANLQGTFINTAEIVAIVVLLVVLIFLAFKLKLELGELKIPIFVYAVVILTMLVKAVSLSVQYCLAGLVNSAVIAVFLTAGAVLFVVSDAVLAIILFANKDTRPMTVLNLVTYFSAQVLLAISIYVVK